MPITQFFDPFGTQLRAQDTESQIASRKARTALDLVTIQQALDEKARQQEYLKRTIQPPTPQQGQPGQPQQSQQPSPSDLILGQMDKIDKNISVAAGLGMGSKVEQLQKERDAMMARYSLAKDRETLAREREGKDRKERIASVSRFASGANAILSDDSIPETEKLDSLKALEKSAQDESPDAYRVISGGQPSVNWGDPKTWARMKALEQQAIDPTKRQELALKKKQAEERAELEKAQIRRMDALIAVSREGGKPKLPTGFRWANEEHTEMEPIPERGASKIPKDVHGEEYLKQLPEEERGLIKGIADGRIDPRTLSIRGGHREAILKQVTQYKPGYNQAKYPVYQAVQKDFTSGVAARNVTSINTAIGHIGTMESAADALKNHDVQAVNRFVNAVANQTGDPRINNFQTAASAVSSELMRVFRGIGASESETKEWEKRFSHIQSEEQLRGAAKMAASLLESRIAAVNDQWKRGMDSKEGYPDLLSPKSRMVLKKLGIEDKDSPEEKTKPGEPQSLDAFLKSKGY